MKFKNPTTSSPFWKRINVFKSKKQHKISDLIFKDKTIKDDLEKANIFKNQLEETFRNDDHSKDKEIDNFLTNYFNDKSANIDFKPITCEEVQSAIKIANTRSATGPDAIHNQMLKNLPLELIKIIIDIFNRCIHEDYYPKCWKISMVSMISKPNTNKLDPNNYRPISIGSCLGKIFERIINNRLYSFVESNKLISFAQSGFRKHRSTKDNITFLTQKVIESFNRKKNVCCLFFDISKAFDKVWWKGLLYKLTQMKTHRYIVNWVKNFLNDRGFKVKINESISSLGKISAGVPQGAIISPLLFNIYINDIPKRDKSNVKD
jgi:hypothetical protein